MIEDVNQVIEHMREDACGSCIWASFPDGECVYPAECFSKKAANLLESLSAELEQVKSNAQSAATDMKKLADQCGNSTMCTVCSHETEVCLSCEFEWRGVPQEVQ